MLWSELETKIEDRDTKVDYTLSLKKKEGIKKSKYSPKQRGTNWIYLKKEYYLQITFSLYHDVCGICLQGCNLSNTTYQNKIHFFFSN